MNSIETVQQRETALKIKTILVAVDLSSHSERTVAYAVPIARQFGASLKVIHVYAPPNGTEFGAQDMCRLLEKDRDDVERSLASLVDRVRAEYPRCESILRTGDVPEQIASSGPCLADLRHSIFLDRRPMDYRLPVAENDTYGGQSRRAAISLVQVEPPIFDRRRTRKA